MKGALFANGCPSCFLRWLNNPSQLGQQDANKIVQQTKQNVAAFGQGAHADHVITALIGIWSIVKPTHRRHSLQLLGMLLLVSGDVPNDGDESI
jgi:hypothetical protein